MSNVKFRFEHALLPHGVLSDVVIEVDRAGAIVSAAPAAPGERTPVTRGFAVPGIPNVHSHAHQRAMAGLAEVSGPSRDSFWTWRERMYANALTLTPADLEAVAAQAYVEMLKAGFTAVGEFQYLHHQPDGTPYADRAEMTRRCLAAATDAGIAITLLPTLYAHGGFGGQPPGERQRRFLNDSDGFLRLLDGLSAAAKGSPDVRIGLSPHSLRAVTVDLLRTVFSALEDPLVHIHVAEQVKEVEDCVAFSGRRPVDLLLDSLPVSTRWCAIHATHMTAEETVRLARTGAVAGLCPITEANLGDGFFNAAPFLAEAGRIGLGSDSNVEITAAGEVRLLEYGQRLLHRERNALAGGPDRSTGTTLLQAALAGGAQALDRAMGAFDVGRRADIVVLDLEHPALAGRAPDAVVDCWIFAAASNPVRDVYVAGRKVIDNGRHVSEDRILRRYLDTLKSLGDRPS